MRVYLANVGANSGHRFASPLFKDGMFEFIPIPEGEGQTSGVRYSDLRSHNEPSRDLLRYVPSRRRRAVCHNDPEFETLTYGDSGDNPKSSRLTRIQPGDALLFLARLEPWADGKRAGEPGFYLIGGLSADYAEFVTPQSGDNDISLNTPGKHVLISGAGRFTYWGKKAPTVPPNLGFLVPPFIPYAIGHRRFQENEAEAFIDWFEGQPRGRLGDPTGNRKKGC